MSKEYKGHLAAPINIKLRGKKLPKEYKIQPKTTKDIKAKRMITVTIINPEALQQASINFTKALFEVFVKSNAYKEIMCGEELVDETK
jgi:hypothetical protein